MRKRRKYFVFALLFALLFSSIFSQNVKAATNEIKVVVNGVALSMDQAPIIQLGRVLVPLRSVFESLGASVYWDNATQTVIGKKGKTTVELTIGDKIAKINGTGKELEVPPRKINGRTLVPLRFVAESLGATVQWDKDTRTATIDDDKRVAYVEGVAKNIEVDGFKFYNTIDGNTPSAQILYNDSFKKVSAKFINCEVNLRHSIPGKRLEVPLRVIYYNPSNKILNEKKILHIIDAGAYSTTINEVWGYGEAEKWLLGTYTVKILDEKDNEIAVGKFKIIE